MKNSFNIQFNIKVTKEEECVPKKYNNSWKKQGSDN